MNENDDADSWEHSLAIRVGERIKHYRSLAGISAQKLSERTVTLGHEVKRATIAAMENRLRTTVPLADVLVLARALSIAPVLLMFPFESDSPVEALPGEPAGIWAAYDWTIGAEHLGNPAAWVETLEENQIEVGRYRAATQPIKLRFEYERTLVNINSYSAALRANQVEAMREDKSPKERAVFERQASEYARLVIRATEGLNEIEEELASRGVTLRGIQIHDSAPDLSTTL